MFSLAINFSYAGKQSLYDKKLETAEKLLKNKKTRKKALKQLESLSRLTKQKGFTDSYLGYQGLSLLSKEYRNPTTPRQKKIKFPRYNPEKLIKNKSFKKASDLVNGYDDLSIIQKWQPKNPQIEYCNPKLLPFLENAHCKAVSSEVNNSLKMLNFADSNTKGLDKCRVLFKLGEVLFDLGETTDSVEKLEKAKGYLDECLQYGNNFFKAKKISSSSEQMKPGYAEWHAIKKKISRLKLEINFSLLAQEVGPGYADLVKMKTFFADKDWYNAFPLSEKIMKKYSNTIYGAEGRLYWCKMLLINETAGKDADPLPSGEKELLKFIDEKPFGNFRGEAWLELARFNLEHKWDGAKSAFYYKKALNWFRKVRENNDFVDLLTIPQKALAISTPPGKLTYLNEWNLTEYRTPGPKEIITPQAAPWYINDKEKECIFMVGFFKFEEGKFKEAREYFSQISSIDKDIALLERKNFPNALMRLKSCCRTGFIVLPVKSRKLLTSKNRFKTLYAEFKYILEDFKTAEKFYREILNDPHSKNIDLAAAFMGIGICHDMIMEKQDSAEFFIKAYKLSPKTPIGAEGLYRLGCNYQGHGKFEDSIKSFKKYLKEFPDGRRTQNSLFNIIEIYGSLGQTNLCKKYASRFIKKYPDSKQSEYLLAKLYKNSKNKEK